MRRERTRRIASLLSMLAIPMAATAAWGAEDAPRFGDLDFPIAGIEMWRLLAAALILAVALAADLVVRYALRRYGERLEKEENEEKARREEAAAKEASPEEAPSAETAPSAEEEEASAEDRWGRDVLAILSRSVTLPARITIWSGAVRLLAPVLAPEHLSGGIWLSQTLLSLAVAALIYKMVDVIEYWMFRYARRTETVLDDMLVPMVRKSLRVLVVLVAGLHLYNSITGQPITTLLAGLGIGGLAFALAAQDTLKNIFGFVMIVLDRPFVVGERIVFDGHDGGVEEVGFRSTRIRRLDGHVVSVPNARVADSTVHNIGKRPYIRRIMNVTITYDTPLEKVEKAVRILEELLENHEGINPEFPPRVYFNEFNADSLNIIAIYWYHPPEYWDYMAHAQRLNLELMRRFEAEGIEFAFPTQTLYLAGDPNRELAVRLAGGTPPEGPLDPPV